MNSLARSHSHGFDGVVQGVTLIDLMQMECLAMSTRAVRVERAGRTGRIFFTGGQVVHAEVDNLVGEAALFELLRWTGGTFTIEDGLRPLEDSIDRDWHSLVLAAAQLTDELAETPAPQSNVTPMTAVPNPTPPKSEVFRAPEVLQAVHFTETGILVDSRGDDPETVQASFAFIAQLIRHVGGALGLEELREIHAVSPDKKALCVADNGEITALLTTPKANLATLASQLL